MLVVGEHIEQMLRYARILESLIGVPRDQIGGTVIVQAGLSREVVEARCRIEHRVQERITRGGEEMRIRLVVQFDLSALDVCHGMPRAAFADRYRAGLFEERSGNEQALIEQVE